MKGLGTNDHDLIRVVVSRSETDLAQVKREYESIYGETLLKAVRVSKIWPGGWTRNLAFSGRHIGQLQGGDHDDHRVLAAGAVRHVCLHY